MSRNNGLVDQELFVSSGAGVVLQKKKEEAKMDRYVFLATARRVGAVVGLTCARLIGMTEPD